MLKAESLGVGSETATAATEAMSVRQSRACSELEGCIQVRDKARPQRLIEPLGT